MMYCAILSGRREARRQGPRYYASDDFVTLLLLLQPPKVNRLSDLVARLAL